MKKKIEIVPYDTKWPQIFDEESQEVKRVLGNNCIEVYHVGSTSVPGLCAKPQIDIMCVVKNLKIVTDKLENIGYKGRGEFNLPLRLFFSKKIPNDINLHVLTETSGEIEWNLVFQDYLRNNPEAIDAYANVKLKLIKENPNGFKMIEGLFSEYTTQKTEIIMKIAQEAGFNGYRFVIATNKNEIDAYKVLMQLDKIDKMPNVFNLCLYKGIEIVAAAFVDFSKDKLLKINKVIAKDFISKEKMLEKISEWAEFHKRNVIKEKP
ncbi:MAG: hypothetical protein RUMPE_01229 [Eubacteriales bacterium SKADARSKE-1]|nr:hypothetical protein [Eubacteriales bacterium SKADARSKE-1]